MLSGFFIQSFVIHLLLGHTSETIFYARNREPFPVASFLCVFIEFKGMNQIIIEKTFDIPETFTTFLVKYDESDFFPKRRIVTEKDGILD